MALEDPDKTRLRSRVKKLERMLEVASQKIAPTVARGKKRRKKRRQSHP
jgi:hypothetical protein